MSKTDGFAQLKYLLLYGGPARILLSQHASAVITSCSGKCDEVWHFDVKAAPQFLNRGYKDRKGGWPHRHEEFKAGALHIILLEI